jgi:hypothetical protein
MGARSIDPSEISESGDTCLTEIARLAGLVSTAGAPHAWLVTSAASSVETHVGWFIERLVELSEIETTNFGSALLRYAQDDMLKNWDARLGWLYRGFGIDIAGDSECQEFRVVVELRNSLLHGSGNVTRYQASTLPKLLALKKNLRTTLGVDSAGRRIILGEATPILALEVCRQGPGKVLFPQVTHSAKGFAAVTADAPCSTWAVM